MYTGAAAIIVDRTELRLTGKNIFSEGIFYCRKGTRLPDETKYKGIYRGNPPPAPVLPAFVRAPGGRGGAHLLQGYGYKVELLKEEIGEILGISRGHTLIVLGTGNLGRAIIRNFRFSGNGFALLAAFDVDPAVVGTEIAGLTVRHADELEAYLAAHKVDVALLTVPITVAQQVGERLMDAGVKGIWNFTNYELACARPDVVVESVHFSDSLLTLSYLISQREEEDP